MKALVYTGPERLALEERRDPAPGPGEVVVRVAACGICGSDMHAYLGHDERRPAPLVLGHEAAGIVETGPRAGERVAINPLVTCMDCEDCLSGRTNLCARRQILSMPPREGAFAERVVVPARNLVPVPDRVPLEVAALTEPIACAYHAIGVAERVLARPVPEWRTVVLGAGAIGVAAALVLRSRGARAIRVAEPHAGRRARLADEPGIAPYDPASDPPEAGSAHLVVDAVGSARTREEACRLARPGGAIAHIGLLERAGGLDVRRLTLQEIAFLGLYTYTMRDFVETLNGLAAGAFGALGWVEERPLAAGADAFADIRAGRTDAAKLLLRPS